MEEIKVAGETAQFIVIRLGQEQYGIDISYIENIVRMQHITRVPKLAPYLKGVINLRGEVIPIMCLSMKMGLPVEEETKASRIIIIKMEQCGTLGLIVDEVKEVVTLDMTEQVEKLAFKKEDKSNFVQGVGKCAGGLISLLDLNAVTAEKEKANDKGEQCMADQDMSLEKVTENYFDVLREIGNIGAGNAMTALSQLLQCKVDMQVPQVKLLEFKDVGALMGGEEQIMVGIYLAVEGDITGSIMFLVKQDSAKHLVNKIMMGMGGSEGPGLNEMELSAMKEVSNIITGAYLNSLSALTNLKIYPSPPELSVDMAGAILSVPAIEFGAIGDKILLIQSQFYDDTMIDGYFILIPDLESYAKILRSLGMM